MKFSSLPVSLYADITAGRRSLADWFRFAADLGLDGADMSVAHLPGRDPAALDQLRQQAHDAGVAIPVMVTYTDFTYPDAEERKRQSSSLRMFIEAAARMGVSHLRVTAGQAHPGVSREDGIHWAVEGLISCLDYADEMRVTLLYENHTIGYGWTHYDFSQPAEIFLEIVRRTEGSGLRILFDTANPLARGEDPLMILDAVQHRLGVVHVNDIRQAGAFEPVVAGTGVSPIRAVFERLHAIGFDGWISIEEASRTGEEGFRQAIPYVIGLWGEVTGD
ncbi:MAG: TIM barrel protein [Caldilineaceae bacterium]|nr:TIM barrel protein [Caldilineaceae bacterium]